jgi:DNA modification methylase
MEQINKLILGDNLEILKTIDNESVDLIYLDPPFFSNRNYEVIWGDKGEVRSFEDRFSGGIDHYISWLKERVVEMHRILKPTGTIFLHCDWHANAYIRTEILDKIFGNQNFKGEIVWKRSTAHNDTKQGKKGIGVITDTIWYYTKSKEFTYNTLYTAYDEKYIESSYKNQDEDGRRYTLSDLTGPGGASKGNPQYEFLGVTRYWQFSKENMQKLYEQGLIVQSKEGNIPRRKRYLDESPGISLQNLWLDILPVSSQSKEKIGYPTQKPISLLKRIIEMATNENDIVLDPFVGGGTAVAAADKFNRRWIGIDQSVQAIKVTEFRMNLQQDLFSKPFITQLHKYDYDTLRYKDAFEFETFIVQQFGGITNTKQRGDLGLDGKTKEGSPIQVKRSDNIGRNVIDNFLSAVQRFDKKLLDKNVVEQKPIGYIIAFSFGKGAIEEVARLKNKENQIIKLVTVEEIIPIAKKPTIKVEVIEAGRDKKDTRELEFIATAESIAGIEFYAWDFGYQADKGFKPHILIDKTGKQIFKFKAGLHNIAVKVVDNDGLENIEIIKLKVNGKIEQL